MNFSYDQSLLLSSISIDHNSKFSFDNVQNVLEPLFGYYYGSKQLRSIISSADHIWCAYDRRVNQYIACALVQCFCKDNVLYIKLFGVEKFSQGQGIGTYLLKTIKKWGKKEDYSAIILHTQINNNKAIGLYEKVGFKKQYYLKDYFHPTKHLSFIQFNEPDAYQMILYL